MGERKSPTQQQTTNKMTMTRPAVTPRITPIKRRRFGSENRQEENQYQISSDLSKKMSMWFFFQTGKLVHRMLLCYQKNSISLQFKSFSQYKGIKEVIQQIRSSITRTSGDQVSRYISGSITHSVEKFGCQSTKLSARNVWSWPCQCIKFKFKNIFNFGED